MGAAENATCMSSRGIVGIQPGRFRGRCVVWGISVVVTSFRMVLGKHPGCTRSTKARRTSLLVRSSRCSCAATWIRLSCFAASLFLLPLQTAGCGHRQDRCVRDGSDPRRCVADVRISHASSRRRLSVSRSLSLSVSQCRSLTRSLARFQVSSSARTGTSFRIRR